MKYLLDGHTPVPCEDIHAWARWFESEDRHVASDRLTDPQGNAVHVSTIFLGIDHAWGEKPPILFETMIFGGDATEYQQRYATWDEAVAGHNAVVERLQSGQPIEEDDRQEPPHVQR